MRAILVLKSTTAGARGAPTDRAEGCDRLAPMAIHPDLLEILACPVCKTPVEVVKDGAGLRCGQCKRVYPVRDDIPIMLPEEATVEA
jgi:hypothetical protein